VVKLDQITLGAVSLEDVAIFPNRARRPLVPVMLSRLVQPPGVATVGVAERHAVAQRSRSPAWCVGSVGVSVVGVATVVAEKTAV
jgi:hypothetical protein